MTTRTTKQKSDDEARFPTKEEVNQTRTVKMPELVEVEDLDIKDEERG